MESETHSSLVPFRGIRFSNWIPGGLTTVIGPADDIDSSAEARAYVQSRPINAVRLEIEDDADQLRFRNARNLLDSWKRDGIICVDPRPSFYVYEHSFDSLGASHIRRGIIGLVPLDAPNVCVLPHEETWEENRQRRLQLLRDLEMDISPVFLMYDQPEMTALLGQIVQRAPTSESTNSDGIHRLWHVDDPAIVSRIESAMRDQHFTVADGHHRFAASRLYHAEREEQHNPLVLAYCVETHDPGIVIRPFHRVITLPRRLNTSNWLQTLDDWDTITDVLVGQRRGHELAASLPGGDLPVAGVILDGGQRFVTLQFRDWERVESLIPPEISGPARRLDVTVTSSLLIQRSLGISLDDTDSIDYITDADEALDLIRVDPDKIAIIIRPIRLQQVLAVAQAHGTVPAKSTSFVPKVPIGLVLRNY